MCHCNVLRLNKLPRTIICWEQNKPAKQREVGALFGTVLKQKKSLPNKALTLRCFPATICFDPINLLFWAGYSILTHYIVT